MGWIKAPVAGECCPDSPPAPCEGCGTAVCDIFIEDGTSYGVRQLDVAVGQVGSWGAGTGETGFGVGSYEWRIDPAHADNAYLRFDTEEAGPEYGINWSFSGTTNLQWCTIPATRMPYDVFP